MKIVATSDTHTKVDTKLIPDGDVFVHAGDLQTSGYQTEWTEMLEWLDELKHPFKFICFGNHDFHPQNYPGPALQDLRKIGFTVLGLPGNDNYYKAILPNGRIIGGFSLVNGLQERWAFGIQAYKNFGVHEPYSIFAKLITECDIMVTHAPIFGIKDMSNRGFKCQMAGDKLFRDIIQCTPVDQFKVRHYIHGHIHEDKGSIQADLNGNKFMVHNVSMCDRQHNHVGKPLVLDL